METLPVQLETTSIAYSFAGIANLKDTGLLYEINRLVLHPLGLALTVCWKESDADKTIVDVTVMSTEDPEGFVFGDEMHALGKSKLDAYMQREGDAKHAARKAALGYLVQAHP